MRARRDLHAEAEAIVRDGLPRMLAEGTLVEVDPDPTTNERRFKMRKNCTAEEIDASEAKHGKRRA